MDFEPAKAITGEYHSAIKFTIATLVSKPNQYRQALDSFIDAGFTTADCQFIYIDNSASNVFNAYNGLNRLITEATGEYIILCHQDIVLRYDKRNVLEQRIIEMNRLDPNWAVLSNAGALDSKRLVQKVTMADDEYQVRGSFPTQVMSVDEHFIVVKKSANLAMSNSLNSFHFYASDLCILAQYRGYSCYVIDFHLYHASKGDVNESFFKAKKEFIKHHNRMKSSRFFRTTITPLFLSGNQICSFLGNTKWALWVNRQLSKLLTKFE